MELTSSLHFVSVLEDLQIERSLEEIGELGQHLRNGHVWRGGVLQDGVKLLEFRPSKADVVPILLESLIVELLNTLDHLVDVNGQFYLYSSLWLPRVAGGGN